MDTFQNYIKQDKTVLIIASRPLDFDSLGSGLILKKYLESMGKKVTLMHSSQISTEDSEHYSILPFFDEIIFQDTREVLSKKKYDLLILVDGTNLVQYYRENSALPSPNLDAYDKIMHVDHHQSLPEKLSTWTLQKQLSSTAEVILTDIVPDGFIDEKIATLGYGAIVGDTGNFKWALLPGTFKLASKLLDKGADFEGIVDRFFFQRTKLYLEMMAYGILNCEYDDKIQTQFLFLPYEKLQKDGIDNHKLFVLKDAFQEEVARTVKGYPRGFMIYEETKGKIIISVRGNNLTNKINMPEMLMEIGGNGGGHLNACRAETEGDFNQIKIQLINLILKYLQNP